MSFINLQANSLVLKCLLHTDTACSMHHSLQDHLSNSGPFNVLPVHHIVAVKYIQMSFFILSPPPAQKMCTKQFRSQNKFKKCFQKGLTTIVPFKLRAWHSWKSSSGVWYHHNASRNAARLWNYSQRGLHPRKSFQPNPNPGWIARSAGLSHIQPWLSGGSGATRSYVPLPWVMPQSAICGY